ncbi:Na(+)/H(+) exchange regulatory cofactor NHE-RF1a isoform X2 [Lampris incognitus]|uniref:Na(+)/H(+) exchange regulatory cofactor NHE-RF1a isoform X2 n=1 Tax=Lampris incognitus TaxID=2546036 RepID=UPI0024B4BB43|nr:Na(+)/H(+) exchange regulatory cofactor NHE-RF1a isoform X2 [Lampris incognitus]
MSHLRPRLCSLEKGPDGYGFHLHGEKGKSGQFIRLVEPGSAADAAGLLAGDQLAFVNGECVEGESHQQVVARIRGTAGALRLVVVDAETSELLRKHKLQCREEFVTDGIPLPCGDSDRGDAQSNGSRRESDPSPVENGAVTLERLSVSSKEGKAELRPRLCHLKRGASGYGFNLHSEKSKPGQFIRSVDEDSPAQEAGLMAQDKIVQVNSMSVLGMKHAEVVAAIKAGGDETSLLVVDPETDAFFSSCKVLPTEKHLTGPLPEPVSNDESEEDEADKAPGPVSEANEGIGLSMSVAQARERAHQKRSAKKAPPMDWSKRNELFSNL